MNFDGLSRCVESARLSIIMLEHDERLDARAAVRYPHRASRDVLKLLSTREVRTGLGPA